LIIPMIDTIRAIFTYLIALVVVVGGLAVLLLTRAEPAASDTRVVVAGFVGLALQFTFGQEIQTRTARQSAAATAAATPTNGHIPAPTS
jgi:hypothetical protein